MKDLTEEEAKYLEELRGVGEAFFNLSKIADSFAELFESGINSHINETEVHFRFYPINKGSLHEIKLIANKAMRELSNNCMEFDFNK